MYWGASVALTPGRVPQQQRRRVREHRKAFEQLAVEVLSRGHGVRVDQRRLGDDVHALGDRADFERQIDPAAARPTSVTPLRVKVLKPAISTDTCSCRG